MAASACCPLRDVIGPALALARRGLAQDWFTTLKIANAASILRLYPSSAALYLPDGLPPVAPYQGAPGFMKLPALAATLEQLAQAGLRDFYEGDVAAAVVRDIAGLGGIVDATRPAPVRGAHRPGGGIGAGRGGRCSSRMG